MSGFGSLAGAGVRHVFVRDMVLQAAIGVYAHEHGRKQRVRVNVDLAVRETGVGLDQVEQVVSYERVVEQVRAIVGGGHVKLVETVAERIAAACLEDARVLRVVVRVEKLDVFADTGSVGVAVERCSLSTMPD
jgi:dihydroneopterin aldolase